MEMWDLIFYVSTLVFFLSLLILMIGKFVKNVYFHVYQADELFKMEKNDLRAAKNYIYATSDHTRKFIKKYAICKSGRDKYIVCNYTEPYHFITFYVIGYNRRKKVTEVLEIHDFDTALSSKVICLNKKTKTVNIVIGKVDGTVINSNVIKPIPKFKIRLHALFTSMCIVSGLLSLRQMLIVNLGKFTSKLYYDSIYNDIGLIVLGVLFVLIYFFTFEFINIRNNKNRNGGSLDYEFF